MSVPILVCECGLRVKAPGATPGRVGRCPKCGGTLKIPDRSVRPELQLKNPEKTSEPGGYQLEPVKESSTLVPSRSRPATSRPGQGTFVERKTTRPMADGFLPALDQPETNWFASILYPLRGAEGLGMIAATSAIFWLFTVLIPEYCLTLMGDADAMGAPTIGYLIALISSLPVVILLPLAILYWLQYLGRILVSSAMGETIPPRTPDRNFNGFFSGISPWLLWLAMGVSVGMLPLVFYITSRNSPADINSLAAVGLLVLGIPYISLALMLTFLHDHPLAATPWNIAVAILRLRSSYVLLSLFVALALAFIAGASAVAFLLRPNHYRIYLHFALVSWMVIQWTSIVLMRVLGTYYFHHKTTLRWHRESLRWGVAWRL
jgi:hypothetical protein